MYEEKLNRVGGIGLLNPGMNSLYIGIDEEGNKLFLGCYLLECRIGFFKGPDYANLEEAKRVARKLKREIAFRNISDSTQSQPKPLSSKRLNEKLEKYFSMELCLLNHSI